MFCSLGVLLNKLLLIKPSFTQMPISSDLIKWQSGINHLNNNLAGTETLTYYIHDTPSFVGVFDSVGDG